MPPECILCAGEVAGGSRSCLGVGGVVIVVSMCSSHQAPANRASAMMLPNHGLSLVWGDLQQGIPFLFTL